MTENAEKSTYYTDAHRQAVNRYRQARAQVALTMTKEQKEQIQQAATDTGQSVNQYILNKIFG